VSGYLSQSSYFAKPQAPSGGPPRIAGGQQFLESYLDKQRQGAELALTTAYGKLKTKIAKETGSTPPVEGRSFDLNSIGTALKGVGSVIGAIKGNPSTSQGAVNPYTVNYGSGFASNLGMDLSAPPAFNLGSSLSMPAMDFGSAAQVDLGGLGFGASNPISFGSFGG
jgi:hypothetical protein